MVWPLMLRAVNRTHMRGIEPLLAAAAHRRHKCGAFRSISGHDAEPAFIAAHFHVESRTLARRLQSIAERGDGLRFVVVAKPIKRGGGGRTCVGRLIVGHGMLGGEGEEEDGRCTTMYGCSLIANRSAR